MTPGTIRGVIAECTEGCGATFELPAEVVHSTPAAGGTITFTVHVDANRPEAARYIEHCLSHYPGPCE